MFWWLVQHAVVTTLLAGVVALLCWRLRFRPAVQHALWLVVVVKLMTPALIQWPWSPPADWTPLPAAPVTDVARPIAAGEERVFPAAMLDRRMELDDAVMEVVWLPDEVIPSEPANAAALSRSSGPDSARAWVGPAAMYLWLAGAALMAGWQLARSRAFSGASGEPGGRHPG